MSALTLIIIRFAFLALLWVFIFIVLYSLRSDLFGPRLTRLQQVAAQSERTRQSASAAAATSSDAETTITSRAQAGPAVSTARLARRIIITSGPKSGLELDIPATGITIGRSSGSGLQISDDFTSSNHAKVVQWRDQWMVQDLGSTNGTFVDGKRVKDMTPVRVGSQIRIGTTTFELRD